ncbi:MAG: CRISPR-associated protein Cas4 [Candidatus Methanomethyliaceae archaeon]|nr:CRISPR-associated protein Cas4 [Candidatus Methanomethyliaceae archaeon]
MQYLLNANDLYQYYYCPRKIYYIKTLGLHTTKKKMAHGKKEQDKEKKRLLERKDVFGIVRQNVRAILHDVYLEDEKIGLCGVVDVILVVNNGERIPVEIKYTDLVEVTYGRRRQLAAYALLIDAQFSTNTKRGIIYFPEQNKEVVVNITKEDKDGVLADLEKIRKLIKEERLPRQVCFKRCSYCEYLKICRSEVR